MRGHDREHVARVGREGPKDKNSKVHYIVVPGSDDRLFALRLTMRIAGYRSPGPLYVRLHLFVKLWFRAYI